MKYKMSYFYNTRVLVSYSNLGHSFYMDQYQVLFHDVFSMLRIKALCSVECESGLWTQYLVSNYLGQVRKTLGQMEQRTM